MVTRGSYCVCIRVKEELKINIGALGLIRFPPGRYIYVGSALNSLIPRLIRHLQMNMGRGKAIHWHIDYLLSNPAVKVEAIYTYEGEIRRECELSNRVAERGVPVPRFGCSDCSCVSHLYRVESWSFLMKLGLKKMDLRKIVTSSSTSRRLWG